jgi:hypothetical protein
MTSCFNGFLYQGFLFAKIGLPLEDAFVAASIGIGLFVFASELPKATFNEDSLDTFQGVRVIRVIAGLGLQISISCRFCACTTGSGD